MREVKKSFRDRTTKVGPGSAPRLKQPQSLFLSLTVESTVDGMDYSRRPRGCPQKGSHLTIAPALM